MGLKSKRVMIAVDPMTWAELMRLKKSHSDATFDTLINHLVLEHDIAQDARHERNLKLINQMTGKPKVEDQSVKAYPMVRRHKPENTEAEIKKHIDEMKEYYEVLENNHPGRRTTGVGRPSGAKDLKPRKPRQKRLVKDVKA